jgi:hypothetical protein
MRRSPEPPVHRLDIDHATNDAPPPRQINAQRTGTSYLWIGSTGQLIQILNPGDPGYEENRKIVAAALCPNGDTSK